MGVVFIRTVDDALSATTEEEGKIARVLQIGQKELRRSDRPIFLGRRLTSVTSLCSARGTLK